MKTNAQKKKPSQNRVAELAFLYQLGIALASGKDLFTTLLTLQNEILKLIQVDALFVAIYNEATDIVEYPIFFEHSKPQRHPSRRLSESPGLTGAVIESGKTLYLPDLMADKAVEQYAPVDDSDLVLHTFLGIPLVVNEKVIGVLSVQSGKIDAYSKDQIQLMENVAVQAALAIDKVSLLDQLKQELEERKRAEQALQQSTVRLEIIHDIDRALLSTRSFDEIAAQALKQIKQLVLCLRASVTMFDFERSESTFLATSFNEGDRTAVGDSISLDGYGQHIVEELKQNKACFIDDILTDPRSTELDKRLAESGFCTWLYLPLFYQGQLIGSLNLARGAAQPFSKAEADIANDIANELTIASQQKRLYNALQKELEERKKAETVLREREAILEAITFAAEQFLKSSDWRTNINLVLERLGKTLNVTHAYLFEDHLNSEGEAVTSMRYEWTAPGYPSDLDSESFQDSKIEQKGFEEQVEALRRGDVRMGISSTFNPIEKASMAELGVKSILEVPVFVNEREWGAIGFDDFEQERAWSNAEVDALKIAAGVLSAAVQRQKAESAVYESERIYRQAIEAAGAVPYYRNYGKDYYEFVGRDIEKMIGYKPEEITAGLWLDIMKENIPLGEGLGLPIDEAVKSARTGEFKIWRSDMRVLAKNGEEKWITDSAVELFDDADLSYASVGIMQDITERKKIEASLRQREAMLAAATYAAEQFLKSSDWRLSMDHVLERLGIAFHASHAYLFEHSVGVDELEYSLLKYEWTAPGHVSDFDNPHYQIPNPINLDQGSTDHDLRHGRIFSGSISTFPPAEKERLLSLGVKAMVEVPLFVDGKWWGTFGVDDFEKEREWSSAEVDALKIAVGILSGAIQRQDAESAVRESERIYREAIETAGAVPYYQVYRFDKYQFMGQGIQAITGYTPDEMSLSFWNSIVVKSQLVGELAGLEIQDAVHRVRNGEFKYWQTDSLIRAKDGALKWIADTAIELYDGSGMSYGSLGIMQDITKRKLTEANLRKRESILAAVTFAAEQFLRTSDWHININMVLERLGREFNASHAYLFEKHLGADGVLLNSLRHEWAAPGQTSDMDNPAYQNSPVHESQFRRYYEILDSGEPFAGGTSYFLESKEEKAWMDVTGIKALLEMRIVVDGRQWGTLGFDEMVNEREWTTMEVDVLKVAANVLGAAIKRQLDEAALQKELDERKRAERAARLSEEKFSKAFHTTQIFMTIEDDQNLIIDANRSFVDTFGVDRSAVIGRRVSDLNVLYEPVDAEALSREHQAQGFLRDFETRFRRRSGEMGFVLLSSENFYVDGVQYILTSGLDITERKRAEENYRSIFNNSIDGIFQSTDDGRFINVNPAMARIYGYASPEDMLRSVNDIGAQVYVDAEQRRDVRQRLASGEKLIGYETMEYRKDGSTFWSSMTAQAVMDEAGRVLYYEGTVEDVTPRKQAEIEREKLINDLESKNTELERFTYTVSHDLKSPLVTINGFLGYLEQDAASGNMERLKKDSHRIQEAVNKMQRLLNELLELSRIGRIMNAPQTTSFDGLVREALEIVQGRLNERNVSVHIQPNLSAIYGDKPRLVEVMQNLLDNAAKYMGDQPEPRIEIGQRGEDAESGQPVFYVKDNGMGVAPEYHERIFGLFNKLDARSEGTGVGLALVKRIIEVHEGRIWIESELGQGSTFLFTLLSQPKPDSVI